MSKKLGKSKEKLVHLYHGVPHLVAVFCDFMTLDVCAMMICMHMNMCISYYLESLSCEFSDDDI